MLKRIELYTDGACSGNPGPGGWGYLLRYKEAVKENYGGSAQTTNNQMELTAVIRALAATRHHNEIEIHTDSQYVKNGMQVWVPQWKNNNWKTAAKKPVKNKELWQQLDELATSRKIHWVWVRGHAGNPYNERCDELARNAAEKMK